MGFVGPLQHLCPARIPQHCPSCPLPDSPAAGPLGQVLALASMLTVALTAWRHAGQATLGAVDQVVALVAIAFEVSLQCAHVHCQVGHRGTWKAISNTKYIPFQSRIPFLGIYPEK